MGLEDALILLKIGNLRVMKKCLTIFQLMISVIKNIIAVWESDFGWGDGLKKLRNDQKQSFCEEEAFELKFELPGKMKNIHSSEREEIHRDLEESPGER